MKFGSVIDLDQNELQNAVIQVLSTAPSSPVEGQIYYDSDDELLYYRDSTVWVGLGSGSGTVLDVAVASANGFAGTSDGNDTTPTITISTSITGILKGNGTALSAAAAGTDYLAPSGSGAALTGITVGQVSGAAPLASPTFTGTPAAPTATVGTNTTQVATTAFVQSAIGVVAQGMDPKPTAYVATAAALPALTYANGTSGVGATLTADANGQLTVDGVALVSGDIGQYVLVKNQVAGLQNGLYSITAPGDGGTPFILTRATEMDTAAEFPGAYIIVEDAGTANANSFWVCTNSANPTVGTTAITFAQLNGATQLVQGTGITISGNTISVTAGTYQPLDATLTAFAALTIAANSLTIGTGADAFSQTTFAANTFPARASSGNLVAKTITDFGLSLVDDADAATGRATLGAVGKYSALIGDNSATSFNITQGTHGLASNAQMIVSIYDASTGAQVITDVSINNSNGTVTIAFAVAPASNAYRVVLIG